jgi:Spy/CpxP family protein refolding chaperone
MAARMLDLSQEQQAAAKQLQEQHRTAVEPLVKDAAALRREVREALEAGGTDAAAIGEKVIAAHGLMAQVRESREDLEARFEALLTPEQRQTFETLKKARERMRASRGKRGHRGPGFEHGGPAFGPGPEDPLPEAPPEEF